MAYRQLYRDAERQQVLADTLTQKAMQSRAPQRRGRIEPTMGWGEGLSQIGEALIARHAGKKASGAMSEADQAKREAQARALKGLSGQQDPNFVGPPKPVNPYESAQSAIEAGVNPGVVGEYLERQRPVQPETTDDLREYQAAQQQGYQGSLQDWIIEQRRAGASSTSVDARNTGTIPPGYELIYDDQGRPSSMQPIPGSPAAQEAAEIERANQAKQQGETEQAQLITQEIDRTLQRMDEGILPDVGFGAMLSFIPYTDAKAISGFLGTIKANIGFDELNKMRQQSPTGGALGQVSEREIDFLQALAGNLDQSQEPEILRDNLNRLWNGFADVVHGPGNGPPRRPLQFEQSLPSIIPNSQKPRESNAVSWSDL